MTTMLLRVLFIGFVGYTMIVFFVFPQCQCITEKPCFIPSQITVLLHAQSLYSVNFTGARMGSEITTLHLQKALERRSDVRQVLRFGPLSDLTPIEHANADILIIEGWREDVPSFIAKVRKHNKKVVVMMWILSLWGISSSLSFDVDGYLTNSLMLLPILNTIAPTAYVPLGVDFTFTPTPALKYAHNVTFLGQNSLNEKHLLYDILQEASSFGLAIYGSSSWNDTEYAKFYKGPLPANDITLLYASSKVALAVTKDSQKNLGMINNRVMEVIGSRGAVLLSDAFPEVEALLQGSGLFYHRKGDATKALLHLLQNDALRRAMAAKAYEIAKQNTYGHRVPAILTHYRTLLCTSRESKPPSPSKKEARRHALAWIAAVSPIKNYWNLTCGRRTDDLTQIEINLHPWSSGISADLLKATSAAFPNAVTYQILNKKLYRSGWNSSWCSQPSVASKKCEVGFRSRMHGIETMLLRFLHMQVLGMVNIPPVEFVVNLESKPRIMSQNSHPLPLFSVWKETGFLDILYPDETFAFFGFIDKTGFSKPYNLKDTSIIDQKQLETEGRIFLKQPASWHFSAAQYINSRKQWTWALHLQSYKWKAKEEILFWRGSPTGGHYHNSTWKNFPRTQLAFLSAQNPQIIDAGFVVLGEQVHADAWSGMKAQLILKEPSSLEAHGKFKYLLDIDGNAAATRLHKLLGINSLIIKQLSPYHGFYFWRLHPFVHYLPVSQDLYNLLDVIHGAKQNDQVVQEIVTQASSLFTEHLSPTAVDCYFLSLLIKFGELLTWEPKPKGDVLN